MLRSNNSFLRVIIVDFHFAATFLFFYPFSGHPLLNLISWHFYFWIYSSHDFFLFHSWNGCRQWIISVFSEIFFRFLQKILKLCLPLSYTWFSLYLVQQYCIIAINCVCIYLQTHTFTYISSFYSSCSFSFSSSPLNSFSRELDQFIFCV